MVFYCFDFMKLSFMPFFMFFGVLLSNFIIIYISSEYFNCFKLFHQFMTKKYITINGYPVLISWSCIVSNEIKEAVYQSKKFKDFIKSIDYQIVVYSIEIQSVDMFGKNVGFIKLKATASRQGKSIPGIVFIRGDSVGIYVQIINKKNKNEKWVLMTQQARLPIGRGGYLEICAGMMDEDGNFKGKAAEELKEELNLNINSSKLISLNRATRDNSAFVLSGGGCDEKMKLYKLRIEMPPEEISKLDGKLTGLVDSSEHIIMRLIPENEITKIITDAKSILAHYLSKIN